MAGPRRAGRGPPAGAGTRAARAARGAGAADGGAGPAPLADPVPTGAPGGGSGRVCEAVQPDRRLARRGAEGPGHHNGQAGLGCRGRAGAGRPRPGAAGRAGRRRSGSAAPVRLEGAHLARVRRRRLRPAGHRPDRPRCAGRRGAGRRRLRAIRRDPQRPPAGAARARPHASGAVRADRPGLVRPDGRARSGAFRRGAGLVGRRQLPTRGDGAPGVAGHRPRGRAPGGDGVDGSPGAHGFGRRRDAGAAADRRAGGAAGGQSRCRRPRAGPDHGGGGSPPGSRASDLVGGGRGGISQLSPLASERRPRARAPGRGALRDLVCDLPAYAASR